MRAGVEVAEVKRRVGGAVGEVGRAREIGVQGVGILEAGQRVRIRGVGCDVKAHGRRLTVCDRAIAPEPLVHHRGHVRHLDRERLVGRVAGQVAGADRDVVARRAVQVGIAHHGHHTGVRIDLEMAAGVDRQAVRDGRFRIVGRRSCDPDSRAGCRALGNRVARAVRVGRGRWRHRVEDDVLIHSQAGAHRGGNGARIAGDVLIRACHGECEGRVQVGSVVSRPDRERPVGLRHRPQQPCELDEGGARKVQRDAGNKACVQPDRLVEDGLDVDHLVGLVAAVGRVRRDRLDERIRGVDGDPQGFGGIGLVAHGVGRDRRDVVRTGRQGDVGLERAIARRRWGSQHALPLHDLHRLIGFRARARNREAGGVFRDIVVVQIARVVGRGQVERGRRVRGRSVLLRRVFGRGAGVAEGIAQGRTVGQDPVAETAHVDTRDELACRFDRPGALHRRPAARAGDREVVGRADRGAGEDEARVRHVIRVDQRVGDRDAVAGRRGVVELVGLVRVRLGRRQGVARHVGDVLPRLQVDPDFAGEVGQIAARHGHPIGARRQLLHVRHRSRGRAVHLEVARTHVHDRIAEGGQEDEGVRVGRAGGRVRALERRGAGWGLVDREAVQARRAGRAVARDIRNDRVEVDRLAVGNPAERLEGRGINLDNLAAAQVAVQDRRGAAQRPPTCVPDPRQDLDRAVLERRIGRDRDGDVDGGVVAVPPAADDRCADAGHRANRERVGIALVDRKRVLAGCAGIVVAGDIRDHRAELDRVAFIQPAREPFERRRVDADDLAARCPVAGQDGLERAEVSPAFAVDIRAKLDGAPDERGVVGDRDRDLDARVVRVPVAGNDRSANRHHRAHREAGRGVGVDVELGPGCVVLLVVARGVFGPGDVDRHASNFVVVVGEQEALGPALVPVAPSAALAGRRQRIAEAERRGGVRVHRLAEINHDLQRQVRLIDQRGGGRDVRDARVAVVECERGGGRALEIARRVGRAGFDRVSHAPGQVCVVEGVVPSRVGRLHPYRGVAVERVRAIPVLVVGVVVDVDLDLGHGGAGAVGRAAERVSPGRGAVGRRVCGEGQRRDGCGVVDGVGLAGEVGCRHVPRVVGHPARSVCVEVQPKRAVAGDRVHRHRDCRATGRRNAGDRPRRSACGKHEVARVNLGHVRVERHRELDAIRVRGITVRQTDRLHRWHGRVIGERRRGGRAVLVPRGVGGESRHRVARIVGQSRVRERKRPASGARGTQQHFRHAVEAVSVPVVAAALPDTDLDLVHRRAARVRRRARDLIKPSRRAVATAIRREGDGRIRRRVIHRVFLIRRRLARRQRVEHQVGDVLTPIEIEPHRAVQACQVPAGHRHVIHVRTHSRDIRHRRNRAAHGEVGGVNTRHILVEGRPEDQRVGVGGRVRRGETRE